MVESLRTLTMNTLKNHFILIKFTLSITVVFSAVISYLLVPNVEFSWTAILWLSVGGLFVTGAANALNQVYEKDTDSQMQRTANRPVASGKLSAEYAQIFAWIILFIGFIIFYYKFNTLSAFLAVFSFFIYVYIYTPLKKINNLAVFVGGIPGALPCLIGWVAGNQVISIGGWVLFLLQFFWQFPHFWAIAWVAYNDYIKVGFKLLPSGGKPTKLTALQTIFYCLLMFPIGILPYYYHLSGFTSMLIIIGCNILLLWLAIRLFKTMQVKEARYLMFGSYLYLPTVLFSLLFDKF